MSTPRIMLVEDEAIIAMDLAQRLEEYGYAVVATAVSCTQAMERVESARPDLIIMDIMIKGPFDGIETATRIHDQYRVPVIFLSANSEESTIVRARAAGAYGYLVKPFRPEELRASIEVALVKATMEAQLRQSEQWFAKTLRCISDAVIATDVQGRVRFLNPVAERLTGWSHDEATGRPIQDVVRTFDESDSTPLDNPVTSALFNQCVAQATNTALLISKDGSSVTVEEGAAPIVDDERTLMGAVMVFRDVTQRRQVERALRESEERFHSAFDHASIGMALVAMDGGILQTNPSIAEMFGYSELEMHGMNLRVLSHPDDLQSELNIIKALSAEEVPSVQIEKRYMHRRGHPVWTLLSMSLVRGQDEVPLYCIVQIQDLTARRQAEERLVQMAHYDMLTGLVNRTYFIESASQYIARARRRGEQFGLIFLDLDGFKTINDSLGHAAGDMVLTAIAKRLRDSLRDSDVICRWGGDEFVLIAEMASTREQLIEVVTKLLEDIGQPLLVNSETVSVSASIGIAVFPGDGATVSALVANADAAMYQAKEQGKNQYCFAAADNAPAIVLQSRRENELRHAVERDELILHFQPILHDNCIVSVEALVRWMHPKEGLLSPGEFIPIAERSGLILPLGEWVMRTACTQAREWRNTVAPDLRVAVNVSARQLRHPGFVDLVATMLESTGLDAAGLELEVTESWLMTNLQRSVHVLTALSTMGVEITVDDFGTGYSSLAYLKRLSLDRLKIDQSFLVGLPGDPHGEAIVRAIVSLADALSYEIVAEGVETYAQQDYLLGLGDMHLQGYGLYRPMDALSMTQLLNTHYLQGHASSRAGRS